MVGTSNLGSWNGHWILLGAKKCSKKTGHLNDWSCLMYPQLPIVLLKSRIFLGESSRRCSLIRYLWYSIPNFAATLILLDKSLFFCVSNSHYIKPKIFLVKFVRSPCLLVLHHLRFLKSRVPRNDGWLPSGKQMLCYWKLPFIVDFHWFPHSKWWLSIVFCMFTRPGMSFQIKMTIGDTLWPQISPPLSSMSFLAAPLVHGYFGISIFDDTILGNIDDVNHMKNSIQVHIPIGIPEKKNDSHWFTMKYPMKHPTISIL